MSRDDLQEKQQQRKVWLNIRGCVRVGKTVRRGEEEKPGLGEGEVQEKLLSFYAKSLKNEYLR